MRSAGLEDDRDDDAFHGSVGVEQHLVGELALAGVDGGEDVARGGAQREGLDALLRGRDRVGAKVAKTSS